MMEYQMHYQNRTLRIDCSQGVTDIPYLGWHTASAIKVLGEANAMDSLEVCARYLNMTEAKLQVSVEGNNAVITSEDQSPL